MTALLVSRGFWCTMMSLDIFVLAVLTTFLVHCSAQSTDNAGCQEAIVEILKKMVNGTEVNPETEEEKLNLKVKLTIPKDGVLKAIENEKCQGAVKFEFEFELVELNQMISLDPKDIANEIKFKGVERCQIYTFTASLKVDRPSPSPFYTEKVYLKVNSDQTGQFAITSEPGPFSAKLTIKSNSDCHKNAEKDFTVKCPPHFKNTIRDNSKPFQVYDLLPDNHYQCTVETRYYSYRRDNQNVYDFGSAKTNYTFNTTKPVFQVKKKTARSIEMEIDKQISDYRGHLEISVTKNKKNESLETFLSKGAKYEDLTPFNSYKICLQFKRKKRNCQVQIKDCKYEICIEVKTDEDCPDDEPEVSLQRNSLSENSFKIEIRPPSKLNGALQKYHLNYTGSCPFHDPACEIDCTRNTIAGNKVYDDPSYERGTTIKALSDLKPYTKYALTVKAENSVCKSQPSNTLTVTTRPSLAGIEDKQFDFFTSSGDRFIQVTVKPVCPFPGALEYEFHVSRRTFQVSRKTSFLTYDPTDASKSSSIKFEGLINGQKYEVCLKKVKLVQSKPSCDNNNWGNCEKTGLKCEKAETICKPIPEPKKKPYPVDWTADEKFDPYREIMVELPEFTFNGTQSGISRYTIQAKNSQVFHRNDYQASQVNFRQNNKLSVVGLQPGQTYNVTLTAFGCKDSQATTDPVTMTTNAVEYPIVELISSYIEDEQNGPDTYTGLILLKESKKSILHLKLAKYTFGMSVYRKQDLFKRNEEETKDSACLDPKKYPDVEMPSFDVHFEYCLLKFTYRTNESVIRTEYTSSDGRLKHSYVFEKPSRFSLASLLGGLLSIVVLLCFMVTLFFVWSRKLKRKQIGEDNPLNLLKRLRPAQNVALEREPLRNQNAATDQITKKMTKRSIVDFVNSADFDVRQEYKHLDDLDHKFIQYHQSTDEATKWSKRNNPLKIQMNRYGNILPYDKNRVVLKEPINGCDYINASWIRGFGNRRFIATQGPLEETYPHFWRMIVENNVKLIVNLTKLRETKANEPTKFVTKCHQYWPTSEAPIVLDEIDLRIELPFQDTLREDKNVIVRELTITRPSEPNAQPITVTQLHYLGWPDHGIPNSPEELLRLHRVVKRHIDNNSNPAVIHCSAGVGRTGTLIGLDTISRQVDDGADEVDVFGVVFDMRRDRTLMVQKSIQYKYLYQCVAAHIQLKNSFVDNDEEYEHYYNAEEADDDLFEERQYANQAIFRA